MRRKEEMWTVYSDQDEKNALQILSKQNTGKHYRCPSRLLQQTWHWNQGGRCARKARWRRCWMHLQGRHVATARNSPLPVVQLQRWVVIQNWMWSMAQLMPPVAAEQQRVEAREHQRLGQPLPNYYENLSQRQCQILLEHGPVSHATWITE